MSHRQPYHRRRRRSIDWDNLPRPDKVDAAISHDGMTLELKQVYRRKHDLEIVLYENDGTDEFAIMLNEQDLKDLFYWLSMHLTNINRINAGLGALPIWNGQLRENPKAQLALLEESNA